MKQRFARLALAFLASSIIPGSYAVAAVSTCGTEIATRYIVIAELLANDNWTGVNTAGIQMSRDADKEKSADCKDIAARFKLLGAGVEKAKDLKAARDELKKFSDDVKDLYIHSRPKDVDVLYCPMAKAYWLQKKGPVNNPYFGKEMRECGMVVTKKIDK